MVPDMYGRWCVYVCQVHRATYKGQQLAIKIQRQGLRELFDLDLKNLKVSTPHQPTRASCICLHT